MNRTALYRHFDASGCLLYVGISDCLSIRDKQHAATSEWHHLVDVTKTEWCVSRNHALALERVAIRYECPKFNIAQASAINDLEAVADVTEQEIIQLIEQQAKATGLSEATVCERAVGNSRLYSRLISGGGCSTKTVARLTAHFDTQNDQGAAA